MLASKGGSDPAHFPQPLPVVSSTRRNATSPFVLCLPDNDSLKLGKMGVIGVEHLVTTTLMPGTVNTTEEIPWVETTLAGGFRVWQVLFLAGAVVLSGVIVLCCCVRIRIPRTKQEIDADFRRKQLSKRFKQELKRIRNSELDVMDLRRALDRVRADFHSDSESGNHSDIFSSLALNAGVLGVSSPGDRSPVDSSDYNVTQQWLEMQMSKLRTSGLPK